jgi:biotin synthase-related radical SAM superfamily protein
MTATDFIEWLNSYLDQVDPERSEFTEIRKKIEEVSSSEEYQNEYFSTISGFTVTWSSSPTYNCKIKTTDNDKMDQESN